MKLIIMRLTSKKKVQKKKW